MVTIVDNTVQLTLVQHGFELHGSTYTHIFFSIKCILHGLWLVEYLDVKLWLQKPDYKVILRFSTVWEVDTPNHHIFQGSTVLYN